MDAEPRSRTTAILEALARGESDAAEQLMPLVYDELHGIARRAFGRWHGGQTLQPTALVNEAYLRLVDDDGRGEFSSRAHFMAVAATAMRQILIDQARRRGAQKRGGDRQRVQLDEAAVGSGDDVDIVALDTALRELAELHARAARVVELRFFGGLSIEETAEATGTARSTVTEDWKFARAWLACRLEDEAT